MLLLMAAARKLLVALWKYVHHGVAIEGAVLKTAPKACRKPRSAGIARIAPSMVSACS